MSNPIMISGIEFNAFYIVVALIGIPLLLGFLTEAGKDLYNMLRKKKTVEEFAAACAQLRSSCESKALITTLRDDAKFMMGRQNDLRDDKLPEMEKSLTKIQEKVGNISEDLKEVKADIKNIEFLINQTFGAFLSDQIKKGPPGGG